LPRTLVARARATSSRRSMPLEWRPQSDWRRQFLAESPIGYGRLGPPPPWRVEGGVVVAVSGHRVVFRRSRRPFRPPGRLRRALSYRKHR
jgi:hypothetical protein